MTVDINPDKVFEVVYKTTAYAAVQRGDSNLVANEDNANILTEYYAEGWTVLGGLFAPYSPEFDYENDDVSHIYPFSVALNMPGNWGGTSDDLEFLTSEYMANFVLYKWFGLTSDGERFATTANGIIENIKIILAKRLKPEYGK